MPRGSSPLSAPKTLRCCQICTKKHVLGWLQNNFEWGLGPTPSSDLIICDMFISFSYINMIKYACIQIPHLFMHSMLKIPWFQPVDPAFGHGARPNSKPRASAAALLPVPGAPQKSATVTMGRAGPSRPESWRPSPRKGRNKQRPLVLHTPHICIILYLCDYGYGCICVKIMSISLCVVCYVSGDNNIVCNSCHHLIV